MDSKMISGLSLLAGAGGIIWAIWYCRKESDCECSEASDESPESEESELPALEAPKGPGYAEAAPLPRFVVLPKVRLL